MTIKSHTKIIELGRNRKSKSNDVNLSQVNCNKLNTIRKNKHIKKIDI